MLSRLKPRHLIEAAVALAVLAILFAVMIPRFQDAQIRSRVTKALSDMNEIVAAMEAYSLDYPDAVIETVSLNPDSFRPLYLNGFYMRLYPAPGERNEVRVTRFQLGADALADRLDPLPVPPEALSIPDREETGGYYHVHWLGDDASRRAADFVCPPGSAYLGVSPVPAQRLQSRSHHDDAGDYYVHYHPSNGLLSHGFTVLCAPGEVNKNQHQVAERALAHWLNRSVESAPS